MKDATVNHPTALHRLLAEMEALSPEMVAKHEPTKPVDRSEQVIAPLAEPLRAMHALMVEKLDRARTLDAEHDALHEAATEEAPLDRDEHRRLLHDLRNAAVEAEAFQMLFWQSVRDHHPVDPKAAGVGVRAGWMVVDMYGTRASGLDILLGAIFGGLGSGGERARPN